MGTYVDFLSGIINEPLKGPWGKKWINVVGGLFDYSVELTKIARSCGHIVDCPDDAVPYHATERRIEPISDAENTAAWRERIADAWSFWSGSSKEHIRDHLRLYLEEESIEIFTVLDGWLDGAPSGWDTNQDFWQRFWVVVPKPHRWEPLVVGPNTVVGPQTVVGITMTKDELSKLRHHARKKTGHMMPVEAIVCFEPGVTAQILLEDHEPGNYEFIRIPLCAPHIGYVGANVVGEGLVIGQMYT